MGQFDEILAAAGKNGSVRVADYANWVTGISRKAKDARGNWSEVSNPYMSVDGRIRMACDDHQGQGGTLDFMPTEIVENQDDRVTVMVTIVSSIYGQRTGTATSWLIGGAPIEKQHPFEIAETSAIGRALAAMGYGLLPGSGLASAEDMERATSRPEPGTVNKSNAQHQHRYLSDRQVDYLFEKFTEHTGRPQSEMNAYWAKTMTVRLADATVEDAKAFLAELAVPKQEEVPSGQGSDASAEQGSGEKGDEAPTRKRGGKEPGFAWRKRWKTALDEMGLDVKTALNMLDVTSIQELADTDVEDVIATLAQDLQEGGAPNGS